MNLDFILVSMERESDAVPRAERFLHPRVLAPGAIGGDGLGPRVPHEWPQLYYEAMPKNLPIVALGGLLMACQQTPTIPRLGEQPVALTLQVSTRTLEPGKADTIRVTAQNNTADSAFLEFDTDCTIVVTIRDSNNDVVVPPNGKAGCLPIKSVLRWLPNASIVRTFIWKGGTDFEPPGSPTRVPNGSYFVSASMAGRTYSTSAPAFKVDVVP